MAVRKAGRGARAAAAARRAPNNKKKKTTTKKSPAAGAQSVAERERRATEPETLRLRSMNPLFTVSDLKRSLRFYTEALGFFVFEEYRSKNGVLEGVMLKAGACELGLSQDDWAKGRDRQRGIGVRIWCTTAQDLAMIAKRIKAAGHTLTQEPKAESWGGQSLALDDPDGFHLTIHHPDEI
jgi:uncharacterized glyoxalase superfamily protein PhnB